MSFIVHQVHHVPFLAITHILGAHALAAAEHKGFSMPTLIITQILVAHAV